MPGPPSVIREAELTDILEICAVINDGASAYRGVIPEDRWHEPYMRADEVASEIEAGIQFSCYTEDGEILGVMGVQDKGHVVLIRHAYIRTAARRRGIGAELLSTLIHTTDKPILIGTWRAAEWAIDFYQKHGFEVLPDYKAQELLHKYWKVPTRQMETSVVLADQRFIAEESNSNR
jgi:N-acetylglutamate synthase-like GNAT family acetyltransferase